MNTEPIPGFREVAAVRRVDRRHPEEHPEKQKHEHHPHDEDSGHDAGPAVEDLIDHRLELVDDTEPAVLDEDIPNDAEDHDLDILL